MKMSLMREQVLPFSLLTGVLAVITLAGDYVLHRLNLVWVGRYLGILGTLLIIVSFAYSMRKRKYMLSGNPGYLLKLHEFSAWLGSAMILLHAGIHFNAILPWLATVAMSINVVSGMIGKFLLLRARRHVQGERQQFQLRGMSKPEVEQAVFWDALTVGAMAQWRKVHIPIFIVFLVLSLAHIMSIFLFWGWV
ncbi:hypothetical protein QN363_16600 [Undibacterium sp. CCC2.1]|uniref:hypothetical protein n=2 Tax=Undibacterium TaxID=401469 RepID=UPI002B2236AA|nr:MULTISPECIES: hypothetical protein [unclassified Undibacterium]MEB0140650.1 hypothetical protein [Undibacterium sp. CCC2.1]MEB0172414.1 hypothetical protein [Undibacterium sp. CCC1.1]MEB0177696.1 hypothetical protein [Undibacterium sp. CCC3.4]MEB0215536.1 hypothetical protein [Undibacterium sp. 5I2]